MLTKTLAATAALSMLVCAGSALAQSRSSTMIGPKQPIPYSQLNAYKKASPKARTSRDWWAGSASTGIPADTSATVPSTSRATPDSSMGSSSSTGADTAVNPSASTPAPSMPMTPPTNATPQPGDTTMMPNQPSTPSAPPATPPTEPK